MQTSQSPSVTRAPLAPPPPPPVETDEAGLRAELDALNAGLRELKSTDLGVRAYFEMWFGFVSASVGGKLLTDSLLTSSKIAWVVWPLLVLGVLFLVDAVAQKVAQRRLARDEERRLLRQRELRGLLGLEEASIPALPRADA